MPSPPAVPGYRAEVLLGRGGHGEVWRGQDLASGRPVALKLLPRASGGSSRLRAEVAAAGTLAGPHVVPVIDVCAVGDDLVVVTELAGGGSLADVVAARGRLAPAEVVTVLAPIGAVLATAHSRLIVHGDVSPANLLFTVAGRPMLADWGLARAMAELGGSPQGTPGYADPAVLAGHREPDPSADVAGLAATAYAALAGRPPWQSDGPSRVALQRLAPLCPPRLAAAVEAGLAARPADRPGAGEFVTAVLASCDPEPVVLPRRPGRAAVPPATLPRATPPTAASAVQKRGQQRRESPLHRRSAVRSSVPRPGRRAIAGVAVTVTALAVVGVLGGVLWSRQGQQAASLISGPKLAPGPKSVSDSHAATGPAPALPVARRSLPRPGSTTAGATGSSTASADWRGVLQALARQRAEALVRRDPTLLDRVYLTDSEAGVKDRATLATLRRRGVMAQGLRIRVRAVHPLHVPAVDVASGVGASAVLEIVSTVSSYRLVDATSGNTVGVAPASSRQAIRVTLRRTGGGWRIAALGAG